MYIRRLAKEDYFKGYLNLLEQLTVVGEITYSMFCKQFDRMNGSIFVLDIGSGIVGSGTIVIENKFIHRCGKVGHIEDIVVDKDYRGQGYGKVIIDHLIEYGKEQECYKIILDCGDDKVGFYEKCGMVRKGSQMAMYF